MILKLRGLQIKVSWKLIKLIPIYILQAYKATTAKVYLVAESDQLSNQIRIASSA